MQALGGKKNLENIDACTTRLRLKVQDSSAIDEAKLKKLGAKGIVLPDAKTVQVILGPEADIVATEMNDALPSIDDSKQDLVNSAKKSTLLKSHTAAIQLIDIERLLQALGGNENIKEVKHINLTRLQLSLKDAALVNSDMVEKTGIKALVPVSGSEIQLIVIDTDATLLCEQLANKSQQDLGELV